jgi:hypothetical protein
MNSTTTNFLAEPDQTEEEYFYEVSDETLEAVAKQLHRGATHGDYWTNGDGGGLPLTWEASWSPAKGASASFVCTPNVGAGLQAYRADPFVPCVPPAFRHLTIEPLPYSTLISAAVRRSGMVQWRSLLSGV